MVVGQDVGYPVAEAARRLGLSPGALRKRIKRGTVPAYKGLDGQWYVPVTQDSPPLDGHAEPAYDAAQDAGQPVQGDTYHLETAALYERLIQQQADEIAHLRAELGRTQDALAEERRIVAHLVMRVPELQAPRSRAADAAPSDNSEPDQPQPVQASAPAPARPWWAFWRPVSAG